MPLTLALKAVCVAACNLVQSKTLGNANSSTYQDRVELTEAKIVGYFCRDDDCLDRVYCGYRQSKYSVYHMVMLILTRHFSKKVLRIQNI